MDCLEIPMSCVYYFCVPVSVDIGGVVSTIDIRVRYLPPSVTGLAAGQDTSTFSTSGEDANGKKFTITIAGAGRTRGNNIGR